jgi:spectinomycin phosphotransferase
MRSPLERVSEDAIRDVVAGGWALGIAGLRYVPVGAGAYHWIADGEDGRRWFVTCDDLDTKPWLGADRDTVFAGLLAAYGTAVALRNGGLTFVAAPVTTSAGAPAVRVDERHSVSVFEHVDGEPGEWGRPVPDRTDGELVGMLARLHASTPVVGGLPPRGLDLPGRDGLEEALDDLHHRWDGGPLSEPARVELAGHRDLVLRWLDELDRLAGRLGGAGPALVVTHGEPHPGNLIGTGGGLTLVDWDTVALARPERDLWMIADLAGGALVVRYEEESGVALDPEALVAYRRLWALSDLVAYTRQLRREHQRSADADRALAAVRSILSGREPAPYGLGL